MANPRYKRARSKSAPQFSKSLFSLSLAHSLTRSLHYTPPSPHLSAITENVPQEKMQKIYDPEQSFYTYCQKKIYPRKTFFGKLVTTDKIITYQAVSLPHSQSVSKSADNLNLLIGSYASSPLTHSCTRTHSHSSPSTNSFTVNKSALVSQFIAANVLSVFARQIETELVGPTSHTPYVH